MPPQEMKVKRLKPNSSIVDSEYSLNLYERNIEVSNASATMLPIFVRLLEASLPMGVILNVGNHDSERELKRYLPDKELLDLKDELKEVENSKV